MGAMNATGHVLVAVASPGADRLWDLLNVMGERSNTAGPTVHAMPSDSGEPRYCVHPDSEPDVEFRANDLRDALIRAAWWKAQRMDPDDVWRDDGVLVHAPSRPSSPADAWDSFVGDQSPAEWVAFGGARDAEGIAETYLLDGPFPIVDREERLRVAGLLAEQIERAQQ